MTDPITPPTETTVVLWQDQQQRDVTIPLSDRAASTFSPGMVQMLVKSKVPNNTAPAVVHAWLEMAAALGLNPLANEIWLANMGGTVTPLVGRDGYMKKAKEDPAFISCEGQAVYEGDVFEPELLGPEEGWRVVHKPKFPRGKLLGGYAMLLRRGFAPAFFFADINDYGESGNAWKYRDSMIVKCAISYLLRVTYNVSGPAPYDEMVLNAGGPEPAFGAGPDAGAFVGGAASSAPEAALPDALVPLVTRAAAIDAERWDAEEVLARIPLPDQPGHDEAVAGITAELERFLAEHEVTDAEVIAEPPAKKAPARKRAAARPVPEPAPHTGPAEDLQERYEADEAFRTAVNPLLAKRMDLDAALDALHSAHEDGASELPDDVREEIEPIRAALEQVVGELQQLGVPADWEPAEALPL